MLSVLLIKSTQVTSRCCHPSVYFFGRRFLSRSDSVTVSVWNNKKVNRREGAGFLGCVTLTPSAVTRLKDTGCKFSCVCRLIICVRLPVDS